jgi:hypothetical protein
LSRHSLNDNCRGGKQKKPPKGTFRIAASRMPPRSSDPGALGGHFSSCVHFLRKILASVEKHFIWLRILILNVLGLN